MRQRIYQLFRHLGIRAICQTSTLNPSHFPDAALPTPPSSRRTATNRSRTFAPTTDRRAYAYLPVQCFMPTYLSNALNAILRAMNRLLAIAVVACVILFIVAVLIAPTLDLQPSALRAQQWLTLLFSMFSLACLFVICLCTIACPFGTPGSDIQRQQGPSLTDMSCCLLC